MSKKNGSLPGPSAGPGSQEPISLKRWPSEMPLFVISLVLGVLLWALLAYFTVAAFPSSLLVVLYVAVLAALLFVARVGFITHVRGNAARLGPDQFPELFDRVTTLAGRMGLKRVPPAYLMQAGGALNALAARFIRTSMVVLFSDLIEACGDNKAALDMIIAHELAHIRTWHLRLRWLLLPSAIIPFLRLALSRAREYTCDRIGAAGAGDRDAALLGLAVLVAGGRFGPRVNRQSLVAQRRDLNTGWMTLGQWFSTHPPLAKRIAAIDPALSPETGSSAGGVLRALGIILSMLIVLAGGVYFAFRGSESFLGQLLAIGGYQPAQSAFPSMDQGWPGYTAPDSAAQDLQNAFVFISSFLDDELSSGGTLPADYEELVDRWYASYGDVEMPTDPYDGMEIGYDRTDDGYQLWSSGPDGEPQTEDDITFNGPR